MSLINHAMEAAQASSGTLKSIDPNRLTPDVHLRRRTDCPIATLAILVPDQPSSYCKIQIAAWPHTVIVVVTVIYSDRHAWTADAGQASRQSD